MTFPAIDVVILSWNRADLTLATIENVLAQQGVQTHIWLVDQGSQPEDLARIRTAAAAHENVALTELDGNIGVPGGRNLGMRLGKAEYILGLDNDAIFEEPGALLAIVQHFKAQPELGILGLRIKNYYNQQDDPNWWAYPRALFAQRQQPFLATRFSGCAHAIRRSMLEKTRGYDEALFFYWEELDLAYQFIQHGYLIRYEPSIAVLHKVSPEARVRWEHNRYYYLVRNILYLSLKYERRYGYTLLQAGGYFLKGIFNRLGRQAVTGIKDAFIMSFQARRTWQLDNPALSQQARAYLYEHDTRHRGNLWRRMLQEVLVKLPGHESR
ncbi:MAG: glycosyltransferase family 2 protein [Anaerolineales bacterium]|nr:glycosyltransferase family 2 protein [Anaerolineales bacterium]